MTTGFRIYRRGFDDKPLYGADAGSVTYQLYDWPESNVKKYGTEEAKPEPTDSGDGGSTPTTDDDENEEKPDIPKIPERPDWQPTEPKYAETDWKMCTEDEHCATDTICLQHMWAYNGQVESGTGCWADAVCKGSGAWDMFDGRKLQFFCSEWETYLAGFMDDPFGLTQARSKHFDTFEIACKEHTDCPNPDRQQCTYILWEATQDGTSFANGSACYNWSPFVCPGPDFAQENKNYSGTGFSYHTEYSCPSSHGFDFV